MLLSLLCVIIVGATEVYAETEYEIDQKFTSISDLEDQAFAIVDASLATPMAMGIGVSGHGGGWDMYFGTITEAYNSNACFYQLEAAQGEGLEGYYYLRTYKSDGTMYTAWGDTNSMGYFNSQPATGSCCFALGLNGQNGQDGLNLAVWALEKLNTGEFALKNIGTGLYLHADNLPAKYEYPFYFTFCTLKEKEVTDSLPAGEEDPTIVVEDSVLLAEAKALAADLDAVAVGKLLAAIEAAEQSGDVSNLQAAIDQFKADNADEEKDETAKVKTNGWKMFEGNNAAGVCATQFAPAITTYDGRTANLAENYETTTATIGQIIYQDITGLANGSYKVGFYGNAFYTSGRGFESTMEDGANDVAYVFANDQKEFITARIATSTTENNFRQFDVEVTDGTIKLGMGKENPGTNWHTMQIYQLTWFTTAKEAYAAVKEDMASAIAAAKTLAADVNKTVGKEAFDAAIADAEAALAGNMLNVAELEAEVAKIDEAIEVFKKVNTFIDLAEGAYYVIDAESGKMMAAGHDWGTRGIVNETGLDLNIAINRETRMVTFDSQVRNSSTSHFLGSNLYMDAAVAEWALESHGNGFYITNGAQYINIDAEDNLVLSDTPREWIFMSVEQRLAALANATAENPVDATFLIQGANFSRNDQRNNVWNVSEDCTNKNLSGGNNVNNCAESYHSSFTLSQTLYNAPAGKYLVYAQGFYRQDNDVVEELPVFFANTSTAAFPVKDGDENSMSAASVSFSEGLYNIEPFVVNVFEDGALTIGARCTALNQWIIFDNFRLTYLGEGVNLDEIEANYMKVLADAIDALVSEHYEMVTGIERTSLAETIDKYSSVENDMDAYMNAINNLSYATNYFINAKDAYEKLIRAKEQLAVCVENYPYAAQWCKEEAMRFADVTVEMADEAYMWADQLTSYARRIAESHALLEGVEDSENMTGYIMNPDANEYRDYWNLMLNSGGYINIRNDQPLVDANFGTYNYFDGGYWDSDYWDVALQQEVYLPAGKYQLTVSSRASSDVAFTLYAGETSVAMPTIGSEGGLFGRGWNDTSLEFEMPTEGYVNIGVRGESNVIYNWMSFTRFRLAKFPNAGDYNNLYIADNTELLKGNATLPISLMNEKDIVGVQFDVVLPYDMMLTEIENGFRSDSHGFSFNQMGDGSYRVVMASMDNEVIEGNDGVLLNLGIKIPAYMQMGWYGITLKNVVMTTKSLQTIKCSDRTFYVNISGRMGDVNSDNMVDVTDVVMIIDNILQHYNENFNEAMADVNSDGYIDVTDVVNVIDAILGNIELSRGSEMIDRSAYTAFQMDLTIPAGYVLESVSLTDIAKDSHSLAYNMLADGRCRVVVCSMNNEALPGAWDEVISLNLRGKGDAQVNIDRAVFVTIDGERHELMLNPTSIAEISNLKSQTSNLYDLQGRKFANGQQPTAKGLYIIDGKKTVKK